ncbi:hypothetical protein LINPERPRIM_LOCUS20032 [Linum perenne]
MKKVPPILVNLEGVSWLSSEIGRPLNKFVSDGLDIKACIVKAVNEAIPGSMVVDIGEEKVAGIVIENTQMRLYKETAWGGGGGGGGTKRTQLFRQTPRGSYHHQWSEPSIGTS